MINARSETVAEKPAFTVPYKTRRCLIPANGFYEWQKLDGNNKQPWLIGLEPPSLFAFAGLWDQWKNPAGETLESCTILTTMAADNIAFIHHRMPVILKEEDHDTWLASPNPENLLKPYNASRLNFHPVSERVGNVRNDDADLLLPATPVEQQQSLF
jgi:putative SOS response-associated peptidase YedK